MSTAENILRARLDRGAIKALVAIDAEIDRVLIEALMSSRDIGISVLDYLDLERDQGKDAGGDVLLIACTEFSVQIGKFVRAARQRHPTRPIVVLSPYVAEGVLRQAFDAGVDDLVTLPGSAEPELVLASAQELEFTVDKALARQREVPAASRQVMGRMICVLGLKGGTGKTLVASNLGVALATAGHSVAILDLDLQFGDVGLALGLAPERTLYDLVRSGGSLDAEKLDDFLGRHSSGARVMLAPVRPDHASVVTPDFIKAVERVLREMFEFVVIDTPPAFTPEVISAVDSSSDVLMVTMRDSLALKNTKLGLETLDRMGYDRRRVRLLLNRANSDVGIDRQDVLTILGTDADVRLPSHRDIVRSVNRAEPIALSRRSEAGKVFQQLAGIYTGTPVAASAEAPAPAPATKARQSVVLRLLKR